ncbi:hypothetical protein L7F22_047712 [Adiantum nelumboides]|nr:hypothetical protein [Adiantum nelumboides]
MQRWLRTGWKLPPWHRSFCHSSAECRPRLQAILRRKRGSGGAPAHRARGLISAVVCDGMPSQAASGAIASSTSLLVFLREEEVFSCFKKMGHRVFMSTVFILHISSSLKPLVETFEERVLPRTVNFDGSGRITNLRFIRVPAGIKLKLNCPIVIVGAQDCAGILKEEPLRRQEEARHKERRDLAEREDRRLMAKVAKEERRIDVEAIKEERRLEMEAVKEERRLQLEGEAIEENVLR